MSAIRCPQCGAEYTGDKVEAVRTEAGEEDR